MHSNIYLVSLIASNKKCYLDKECKVVSVTEEIIKPMREAIGETFYSSNTSGTLFVSTEKICSEMDKLVEMLTFLSCNDTVSTKQSKDTHSYLVLSVGNLCEIIKNSLQELKEQANNMTFDKWIQPFCMRHFSECYNVTKGYYFGIVDWSDGEIVSTGLATLHEWAIEMYRRATQELGLTNDDVLLFRVEGIIDYHF